MKFKLVVQPSGVLGVNPTMTGTTDLNYAARMQRVFDHVKRSLVEAVFHMAYPWIPLGECET